MIFYTLIKCRDDTIYSEEKGYEIYRRGDTIQVKHSHSTNVIHIPWSWIREAIPTYEEAEHFSDPNWKS